EALSIERVITGKDVRLEGAIRVTTVETLAVTVLTPLFHAFQQAYPGITLELVTDFRTLSLTNREAEVALRLVRPSQPELVARKVGEMSSAIYASAAYLTEFGEPDFATGAPGHRRILVQDDLMHTPEMQWFQDLTAQADIMLRSNSRFSHAAAAADGMGLACIARFHGDREKLVRLQPPSPAPLRELWLVVHQDIRHMPRIRAFTEYLTTALK